MHTMITRPRGKKTPHIICGGRGGEGSVRGEEGGLDDLLVLLTPNNSLKSPSGPIMDSWPFWYLAKSSTHH